MASAAEVVGLIEAALGDAIAADDLRGATGEVVGLLGFSQGAKIAASLLYAQQHCLSTGGAINVEHKFRFAVLLAGRGPLVWLVPNLPTPPGLLSAAQLSTAVLGVADSEDAAHHCHLLQVPTIHVHGLSDPGLELHRRMLKRYCHPDSVTLVEWHGEHRVPIRSGDVELMVQQIYRVAREAVVPGRCEQADRVVKHVELWPVFRGVSCLVASSLGE
ncbi:hypothetical protein QBC33DRAFT_536723 [Phialemonium atrogriseum]|uniref:Serine hydrolase domain-containing protein n=1 Tax=Phialemonium atrogriseum TaxID=1093897 RepID=A0AAJ0C1A0_9PEZI|nr:uncharacterized protein QBC33DRAFT_536723 [Phialemonium atrogriseum]KAK1768290.1 hypothetical protein QBC33DRAFT_536723 [Phialemonium atrogriseum]